MSHVSNKQNSNALEAKETNLGLRAWYIKEEPVTMGQFLPLQATCCLVSAKQACC